MTTERLDQLAASLARTQPRLDDLTRARVAASLGAALAAPAQPAAAHRALRRRRWWLAATATAAAALAVLYLVRGRTPAPRSAVVSPAPAVAGGAPDAQPPPDRDSARAGALAHAHPTPAASAPAPATPAPRPAAASAPAQPYQLAGATITVYGSGWATAHGARILADADALTFDRTDGATPVDLVIRGATIRAQRATFSVDSGTVLRVTVLRGELALTCDDALTPQHVITGGAATCDVVRIADSTPPPASITPSPAIATPSPAITAPPPASTAPATSRTSPVRTAPATAHPATAAAPIARSPAIPVFVPSLSSTTRSPAALDVPAAEAPSTSEAARAPAAPPRADLAPSPPPADPATRYRAAERLLLRDPAAARASLSALIADAPSAPEAAPALLDLARLAIAAGDAVAAHAALDRLAAHPAAAALAMPATYLRCVIERSAPTLRTCLAGFRAAFPDSPRDADVLARLAAATAAAGDCAAALPLIAEYLRRYPAGTARGLVLTARARCEPGPPQR